MRHKLTIIASDNGAWPAPSHYLNQWWNIVNWTLGNKLQWNFNRNSSIFIENVVCEMFCSFRLGLNVLRYFWLFPTWHQVAFSPAWKNYFRLQVSHFRHKNYVWSAYSKKSSCLLVKIKLTCNNFHIRRWFWKYYLKMDVAHLNQMQHPQKHETSARRRASRSVKQSKVISNYVSVVKAAPTI